LSSDTHYHRIINPTKLPKETIEITQKLLESNVREKSRIKLILKEKDLEPKNEKQERQLTNFIYYYKKKL
jgi:hypothetical protein